MRERCIDCRSGGNGGHKDCYEGGLRGDSSEAGGEEKRWDLIVLFMST